MMVFLPKENIHVHLSTKQSSFCNTEISRSTQVLKGHFRPEAKTDIPPLIMWKSKECILMTNYEKIMKTILSFKSMNYKIAFPFMKCSCQYLQTIILLCFYNETVPSWSLIYSTLNLTITSVKSPAPQLLQCWKSWHLDHNFSPQNNFWSHPRRLLKATGTVHPKL